MQTKDACAEPFIAYSNPSWPPGSDWVGALGKVKGHCGMSRNGPTPPLLTPLRKRCLQTGVAPLYSLLAACARQQWEKPDGMLSRRLLLNSGEISSKV
jgi:hypothetical protein